MDLLAIVLRLVHVVLGVVWVGTAVFTFFFLGPAVQDAGPDGVKVMAAMQRRGLLTAMPILALGTMLSGIWLYWRASGGLMRGYVTAPIGLAFGLGGLAAIVAFALGMTVARPAMLRATALAQALESPGTEQERRERTAEVQRLRARSAAAGRLVTLLLVLAAAAMGVARYL